MAIDERLSRKWERKVYEWALWRAKAGAPISPAYSGRIPTGKHRDHGEVIDTDMLLSAMRKIKQARGQSLFAAIVEWTKNEGTRGAQAVRLGIHPDTYRARAEGAMIMLEILYRARRNQKGMNQPISAGYPTL